MQACEHTRDRETVERETIETNPPSCIVRRRNRHLRVVLYACPNFPTFAWFTPTNIKILHITSQLASFEQDTKWHKSLSTLHPPYSACVTSKMGHLFTDFDVQLMREFTLLTTLFASDSLEEREKTVAKTDRPITCNESAASAVDKLSMGSFLPNASWTVIPVNNKWYPFRVERFPP